ncbi:MAG: Asp23/Gls24 family envelope stress response protein [Clostridiales bacterium]|jgi:uncharacterized alkaline shock family protein YloU/ABC-type dipeptide/oligopeptide/nickel transport system ATPase subunit|nr:Asp23/Gls24 family envelope stress response protein [Clostridiales bacterium]MCK9350017.1 Asp23/Gls24 family envelope stress response protein [Clostridiales bacterium]MDY0119589.1 hypothetical protein [Clostridia bacterium]NLG29768.1 Asp23/Gls24 family envelope stress response protein [Clostridiaceae bacterium]
MVGGWFRRKRTDTGSVEAVSLENEAVTVEAPADSLFNPLGRIAGAVISQISERDIAYEEQTQKEIRELLSQIAIVSFIGVSGSGKSTRAIRVAREYNIEYIIDDGLLIHGSAIITGSSAKRADTKMESVRQAMFLDPARAENMRRALVEHLPSALMILGTSEAMLTRICENLWLNQPSIRIRIEDVSSEEERNLARQTRLSEGKHTIPVPSMEIKHEFSGYLAEPFAKFWQRFDFGMFSSQQSQTIADLDKTVVRPTFSTLGSYAMSDQAMKDLVRMLACAVDGVESVVGQKVHKEPYGIILDLDLSIYYGSSAQSVLAEVQSAVSAGVEQYTAVNVLAANVRAVRVAKGLKV